MATYSRVLLSGSTDGMPNKVTATGTPGDTVHTSHASAIDELYLWVSNLHTAEVTLTLEWGGATDPDDLLVKQLAIPANSPPIPVAAGLVLTNSKVVKAFASVADKLVITGYVNRIA
jgi:hypothetical protein